MSRTGAGAAVPEPVATGFKEHYPWPGDIDYD